MKVKKIPQRMCVVTRDRYPKQELIRVVRTPENTIVIDETGKQNGRGAYLKKDISVIEKAQKSKVLEAILEVKINDDIYEQLKDLIK